MPTPLFPPPTPLLSALPAPPRFPVPSPASSSSGGLSSWSPPSSSSPPPYSPLLSLSSSAPAELPSFHLEVAAAAAQSASRRLSASGPPSRRHTGVSLLSAPPAAAAFSPPSAVPLPPTASSSAYPLPSLDGCGAGGLLPTPLLAAALAKQQRLQHQERAQGSQADDDRNTEAISALVTLKPAPPLPHSHSFSVGEARNAALLTLPSSSASPPSASQSLQLPSSASRASVKAAAMSDLRSMARLSTFSSLLAHCSPDTWIVLDLDDTVSCGYHSPCHMMTERGLQRYQALITGHPHYKTLPFATKSSITRQLQAAVSRKRGVERDTIRTIKQLQAAGVPVFALTARFTSMIATTKLELASLSLDMSLTSPFRTFVRDTETSAVISDGIIFTDGQEKGPILDRCVGLLLHRHLKLSPPLAPPPSSPPLPSSRPITIAPAATAAATAAASSSSALSTAPASPLSSSLPSPARIVFKTSKRLRVKKMRGKLDEDDDTLLAAASTASARGRGGGGGGGVGGLLSAVSVASLDGARKVSEEEDGLCPLPRRIVFLDDRLQNCVSVMNGLRCTQQLQVAVLTYHYTPSAAADRPQHSDPDDSDDDAADQHDNEDDDEGDQQRLAALAEYQIHHFIRTQQVLNDAAALRHRRRSSRVLSPTSSPASPPSHRPTARPSPESSPETAFGHDLLYDDDRDDDEPPQQQRRRPEDMAVAG